jgi:hypothetical protein
MLKSVVMKHTTQLATKELILLEQDIRAKEEQRVAEEAMQVRLDQTSVLLQKLQQVQSDRLSLTPPAHLSHVAQPSDSEVQLGKFVNKVVLIQICINSLRLCLLNAAS